MQIRPGFKMRFPLSIFQFNEPVFADKCAYISNKLLLVQTLAAQNDSQESI